MNKKKKVEFKFGTCYTPSGSNSNFSTLFDSDCKSIELVVLNPQTGKEEVATIPILKSIYEQEQRQ